MKSTRFTDNQQRVIDYVSYAFIVLGVIMFFGRREWWPDFYSPYFYGVIFFVSAFLIRLPEIVFTTDDECKNDSVLWLKSAIAIIFTTNALGELYLYQLYNYGIQYDKLIHFGNSLLAVIILAGLMENWHKFSPIKSLKYSILIVVIVSLGWEIFEFTSDLIFKTKEFGIYGQYKVSDTMYDLLADAIGILAGAYLLFSPKYHSKIVTEFCYKKTV